MNNIKLILLATIFTLFTVCDGYSSNSDHPENEISQETPQETTQEAPQETTLRIV